VSVPYKPERAIESLGEGFYDSVTAARFPLRRLRFRNDRAARSVGLEGLSGAEWESHFGRFSPLPENLPEPLALRYHGHQFRSYNPQIGDGRGFLFAQLRDANGRLLDLGTKGSGRTPYSRGGDGRLTLKGGVREVLATEMLEALGVNTSKTFSLIETGERLERHDEPSPTRSSVLVRLSHSHIRFGTFQRHAFEKNTARTKRLVDYCLEHFYPESANAPDPVADFFDRVCARFAYLAASYMAAGFVHGVLNTDNMNVTGESFDYGPWRFLPAYDPGFTAAYFDETGLYAYGRQPGAIEWNLARLAECLAPIASSSLDSGLDTYRRELGSALAARMLGRLGVGPLDPDTDATLVTSLYAFLEAHPVPFQQFFHDVYGGEASAVRWTDSPFAKAYSSAAFEAFRSLLGGRAPIDESRLANPYFARRRPCDLRIEEVEAIWSDIAETDDWEALEWKVADIRRMGAALGSTARAHASGDVV